MASDAIVDKSPLLPGENITYVINGTSQDFIDQSDYQDSGGNQTHGNVDRYLWMYASPFTFLVGIVGNMFIILVFADRTKYNKSSRINKTTTPIYLTVMAIADICFLVFGILPEWLEACQFLIFKEIHPVTCKIEKFMFYMTGDVAIWIITAFTVDRFIAVCFPFKKKFVCVPKYAKIISVTITLIAILKNLHVFWTRGGIYDDAYNITVANGDGSNNTTIMQEPKKLIKSCGRPEPFSDFEYYIRPWIAFAVISIIPFTVILVCNVFIIKCLVSARRSMSNMTSNASNCDKGFIQTTFMCMSASFAFLICITPSMVLYIGKPYWTEEDNPSYSYDIAKAVNNQLVYVNHSINFFLYCVTGRKFREEFVALFTKPSKKNKGSPNFRRNSQSMFSKANTMVTIGTGGSNSAKQYIVNNNNSPASERYIKRLHSGRTSPLAGTYKLHNESENRDCLMGSTQALHT